MSEIKKLFSFSERVRLNDEADAMPEVPYVSWRRTGDVVEPQLGDIVADERLKEQETELLNRFSDTTLSDIAYETISEELISGIEERVAVAPGKTNITKGDFVQLRDGDVAKVQSNLNGIVKVKRKNGQTKKIRVTRLSRIGKHQGKPTFGFLSPKGD